MVCLDFSLYKNKLNKSIQVYKLLSTFGVPDCLPLCQSYFGEQGNVTFLSSLVQRIRLF